MAEALKTRIQSDLNRARKDRDRGRTLVLSTTLSELKNREIELGREASDNDAILVLTRGIKQRRESVEQFTQAGRTELADQEEAEIAILEHYLPAPLSPEEVDELVAGAIEESGASTRSDMGKVMKILQERTAGRADGKSLSQAVMKQLS